MKSELRSWKRLAEGLPTEYNPCPHTSEYKSDRHAIPVDVVIRDENLPEGDYPPVGTVMRDKSTGRQIKIRAPWVWNRFSGRPETIGEFKDGSLGRVSLNDLEPIQTKHYTAVYPSVYPGESEADVRARYRIPDGVELKETDDE